MTLPASDKCSQKKTVRRRLLLYWTFRDWKHQIDLIQVLSNFLKLLLRKGSYSKYNLVNFLVVVTRFHALDLQLKTRYLEDSRGLQ